MAASQANTGTLERRQALEREDFDRPQVNLKGWHLFLEGVHKLQGRNFRLKRVVLTEEVLALGEPDGDWDDVIPLHEAYIYVCEARLALCFSPTSDLCCQLIVPSDSRARY